MKGVCGERGSCRSYMLCLDEEWIQSRMEKIDLDGDGGISFQEFVGFNGRQGTIFVI